ncbi:hypothetical protein FHY55_19385 [Oceanicola sp. D3]|uniref:hypothetical protein n=1 Tax=Oceanicola sp. D3 TaxID=2587163 RepID=UPI001120D8CE|nr:hypothetical protein [Oceanicola sp. D3]QDC11262.1 hypothetical protein FHY55_19385 [Oceanicola sp. D3]
MSAPSAKPLFKAIRGAPPRLPLGGDWPLQDAPGADAPRDPLDYDPTPPEPTRALISAELGAIAGIGGPIWEPAVGGGHMARVLSGAGFEVLGSDIVDRGHPGVLLRSFYDFSPDQALAPIIITNPPYCEVSAKGHCRWLRHCLEMQPRYLALLLSAEWPFARQNGMDALLAEHPYSIEYKICWKIDFRGLGNPAQRNSWFVWREGWAGEPVTRRLFKEVQDPAQEVLL